VIESGMLADADDREGAEANYDEAIGVAQFAGQRRCSPSWLKLRRLTRPYPGLR
jgi:hypothetical protein